MKEIVISIVMSVKDEVAMPDLALEVIERCSNGYDSGSFSLNGDSVTFEKEISSN